jgi:signal transduction histidine kinase
MGTSRARYADEVTGAVQDDRPAGHGLGRVVRLVLWSVLFWNALALFFASQIVLMERGRVSWRVALALSAPRWYVWGLFAPAIFWVDRRLGAARTLGERVVIHIPLGIAWTCLSVVVRLIARPLAGNSWPPSLWLFFLEGFYWDLLIYAVIAGVAVARDYASQARSQERQAHDLALQAADLERSLAEARLQSLRAQLHPHFLFNALNTISAFTETNPQTARRLMGQLGDLLRASLTHASQPLVTLGEELTFLDDYLAIESARFEGRITASVHAEDDLLDVLVPGFLLQPLVENAIRHGVAPRLSGGHVEVTATRDESMLKLRVRDNGVGLRPGWRFDRGAGVGLGNVAARLEHSYGARDLLWIGADPSGGVEVRIDLPLRRATVSSALRAPAGAGA